MPHPGATTKLQSGGATIFLDGENVRTRSAAILFLVVFLYSWVSLYPFENLQNPPANSAAVNQIAGFLLTLGLLAYAAANRLLSMLLRPRSLIVLLFAWLALTSTMSLEPLVALRRLFFTGLLCVCASTLPVLPESREQFDRLLKLVVLILLGASYLGVMLMPDRAIHQVYDVYEPRLAGDWRGIFNHKNTAAPAMVVLCFISLYAMRAGNKAVWAAMAVLAIVFLWKAGGKTALGMFPVTLVLAFLVTRRPLLGATALLATMAVIGTLTIGSALSPGIHEFLAGHGIDATFTARTDIWQIALEAAGQRPLFGYGFGSFWGSDMLLNSVQSEYSWAVNAWHAHNGYIEVLLSGGVPALALTALWLVVLPLRDIAATRDRGADPALTALFARIWVFCILYTFLENALFTGTGAIWASLLLAVFGLRQQARGFLIVERGKAERLP